MINGERLNVYISLRFLAKKNMSRARSFTKIARHIDLLPSHVKPKIFTIGKFRDLKEHQLTSPGKTKY